LDELPQLLNVLRGEMSLVEPRPVLPVEVSCYGEVAAAYEACRTGLTGAWQVCGRSQVDLAVRAHLEIENLRNWGVSAAPAVSHQDRAGRIESDWGVVT